MRPLACICEVRNTRYQLLVEILPMERLLVSMLNSKPGSLEQLRSFLRSRLFLVLSCSVVAALSFWSTLVLLDQFRPKPWRELAQTKLEKLPPLPDKRFSWLGIEGINVQPVARIPGVVTGLPALRVTALHQEEFHTVAWRVTGLIKNERYRITAWVRPLAGANFGIAARDQADLPLAKGLNNGRAVFDLAGQKVLWTIGNGKPGIEEVRDWLTVWLELLTTDGQYVVNVYVCKGGMEIYAADGRLGVILGGISAIREGGLE
jgi:hypothetical protein